MADNHSINKAKAQTSFIRILPAGLSESGKTKMWSVTDVDELYTLGEIKWYGHWRGYAFFPEQYTETMYEQKCLRTIADFLEAQTKLTRAGWRKKK